MTVSIGVRRLGRKKFSIRFPQLLSIITHVDGSRLSITKLTVIRVCVRFYVCMCIVYPHDKTKMAENKIAKLGTGIPRPTINIKIKCQGHRSQSAKRRSSGRCELCTLSSAQPLVYKTFRSRRVICC